MTPLQNPLLAAAPLLPTPLAPSQDYAGVVQQWMNEVPPGEDRTVAAREYVKTPYLFSDSLI